MNKLIGIGAAGNKAVIAAIEAGYPRESCVLINSTMKDIDVSYHDIAINIGGNRGGCGKERHVSRELSLHSLKAGELDIIEEMLDAEDETIHIISSTEGGTGSGAVPLIAKYCYDALELNVIITAFTGFEDDARGLSNTIDFFRDLSENYIVQIISNKKALGNDTNKVKAQERANQEFVNRLEIITGKGIEDSEDNIDETDLYKVISTPGYMTIENIDIAGIKNIDQFNSIVSNAIDETLSVDFYESNSRRIAIYVNAQDRTRNAIDFSFEAIKNKVGIPYEIFTHIQYNELVPESIRIIVTGMNMPIEEFKDVYEKYKKSLEIINSKQDNFFDEIGDLSDDSSSGFDSAGRRRRNTGKAKANFFDELGIEKKPKNNTEDRKAKFLAETEEPNGNEIPKSPLNANGGKIV